MKGKVDSLVLCVQQPGSDVLTRGLSVPEGKHGDVRSASRRSVSPVGKLLCMRLSGPARIKMSYGQFETGHFQIDRMFLSGFPQNNETQR